MNFTGHPDRECGEHRTTGDRAWCFDCTEMCYAAGQPCKGCRVVAQDKRITALENALHAYAPNHDLLKDPS